MRRVAPFFVIVLTMVSMPGWAFESLDVQTKYDHFKVIHRDGADFIGSQKVSERLLRTLQPLLSAPLKSECPAESKSPDVRIRIQNNQTREVRDFFVSDRLIVSGKNCARISGDGIFYLPLHRSFLEVPSSDSIPITHDLKIFSNGHYQMQLVQSHGRWQDVHPQTELDWEFVHRFLQSLGRFQVRYRLNRRIAHGIKPVTLKTQGHTYLFYHLTPKLWAIQKPKQPWLEATDDWSFWYELKPSIWKDRFAPQIEKLDAASSSPAQKHSALKIIGPGWSRSLQELFQRHLLDKSENKEIRLACLKRLRAHPSWDNVGVWMKLLNSTEDEDLLHQTVSALKIRRPGGLAFKAAPGAVNHLRSDWNQWWKKTQNSHPGQ